MICNDKAELLAAAPHGRLMAFDQGSKTIGVAISDVYRTLAQPVTTIKRSKWAAELAELRSLFIKHSPMALVIGYPLNMDGSEGPRCQSVRAFTRNLEQAGIELPILLWDERLSSSAAHDALIASGIRAAKRQSKIDQAAAAVILQSVLDGL